MPEAASLNGCNYFAAIHAKFCVANNLSRQQRRQFLLINFVQRFYSPMFGKPG